MASSLAKTFSSFDLDVQPFLAPHFTHQNRLVSPSTDNSFSSHCAKERLAPIHPASIFDFRLRFAKVAHSPNIWSSNTARLSVGSPIHGCWFPEGSLIAIMVFWSGLDRTTFLVVSDCSLFVGVGQWVFAGGNRGT